MRPILHGKKESIRDDSSVKLRVKRLETAASLENKKSKLAHK